LELVVAQGACPRDWRRIADLQIDACAGKRMIQALRVAAAIRRSNFLTELIWPPLKIAPGASQVKEPRESAAIQT
jgi:hypothetical protein